MKNRLEMMLKNVVKLSFLQISASKKGFTLAEVLITLGIIGVVSAMTLPTLFSNYQSNAYERKRELFEYRLEEAMNQMRFHEKLTGYSSAEDFVEELGKYLKINEVCDSGDLVSCFGDEIFDNENTTHSLEDLKNGTDIAYDSKASSFPSTNMGIIVADGVSAIVNYSKDCEWLDPYDTKGDRAAALQCISIIYDVNGKKGKNKLGSDIFSMNSKIYAYYLLGDAKWDLKDMYFTSINTCDGTSEWDSNFTYANISDENNLSSSSIAISIEPSSCATNYWAGALKACAEADRNLPSNSEWAELASYLYDTSVTTSGTTYADYDEDRFEELDLTVGTYYWSSNSTMLQANRRWLYANYAGYGGNYKHSSGNAKVRCVQ
ncbi:MAG: type II secretion system protein [Candidatus Gastranaerophilales bacterium]